MQAASGPGLVGGEKEKKEGGGEESKRVRKNKSECKINANSKRPGLFRNVLLTFRFEIFLLN